MALGYRLLQHHTTSDMSTSIMYPQTGQPLVPAALLPFLGDRQVAPKVCERLGLSPKLRLADLGSYVWTTYPAETISRLAAEVVVATSQVLSEIRSSSMLVPI